MKFITRSLLLYAILVVVLGEPQGLRTVDSDASISDAITLLQVAVESIGIRGTLPPSTMPSQAPSSHVSSTVPSPSPTQTFAPSTVPSQSPSRNFVATLVRTDEPLSKCEGPCEKDDHCFGSLKCQDRGSFEPVTGCDGLGELGVGYCYDARDGPVAPKLPSGSFRLRLYWEFGYFWQEALDEEQYCLENRKGVGSEPKIRDCKDQSTRFEFVYLQAKQGDMIKVSDEDLCLERTGHTNVTFQRCSNANENQRWRGDWTARRFDIRPVAREGCLSQHHHPKPGETVYVNSCSKAHGHDTGYWQLF